MICPVNTMQDIVDSPQLNAREFFEEVDDPALGRIKVAGAPLKMSATPWQARPAPLPGQAQSMTILYQLAYVLPGSEPVRSIDA